MAYPKRYVKKRVRAQVLQQANVDADDLDEPMMETLGQEAARRVGAAGVQLRVRKPEILLYKQPSKSTRKKPGARR